MDPAKLILLVPVAAIVALVYAFIRAAWVKRQDPGNERMQMIGKWIADGRHGLPQAGVQSPRRSSWSPWRCSSASPTPSSRGHEPASSRCPSWSARAARRLAGFFGMKVATQGQHPHRERRPATGLNDALQVAFSGGSVMGLCVVGLALARPRRPVRPLLDRSIRIADRTTASR